MIAMSNSISVLLNKEQSGVGMGLLSMLNFISGAVAAGLYGKMADLGQVPGWNPVNAHEEAAVFSNVFLLLAAALSSIARVYHRFFRKDVIPH